MKILIVDDESLDLFIAKKLLGLSYEVEGFTTQQEAVLWAKSNVFDVVLIDYYLGPGLFAYHVLKELQNVKGDSFKAFVLSNHVDDSQTQELKAAGFHDIIIKPLTLEKFNDYLQGVH